MLASFVTLRGDTMTLRDLTQALANQNDVRWGNDGYRVQWEHLPDGPAITIRCTANGFGGAMANSEMKDCYIKETQP